MSHPVQGLFKRVAPRYDLLNRLFSLKRDVSWRKAAVQVLAPRAEGPLLDLACGTLDLTAELDQAYPERGVVGCDFSKEMMLFGRAKIAGGKASLVCGNGLTLPFENNAFAGASMAFGIRNIADRPACLAELKRVLKPGGRLVILELGVPQSRLTRMYLPYFLEIMPKVAGLFGAESGDYVYLGQSVLRFPKPEAFTTMMERAGFVSGFIPLTKGIANLYHGCKR